MTKKTKRDVLQYRFRPAVIWFTGLSGSGKSTIADALALELSRGGVRISRLDGDAVRAADGHNLGFSPADRDANISRAASIAADAERHGALVVATFISPYRRHRELVRAATSLFVEVFVNTPLRVCMERDTKGLYVKAQRGEIAHFTGVSDVYEHPLKPDLELDTVANGVPALVGTVVGYLLERRILESGSS